MNILDKRLRKLEVLPTKKDNLEALVTLPSLNSMPILVNQFQEAGIYLKDVNQITRKIETKTKKLLISKNTVTGLYIELKDYLSFKFYGRIVTIDDLFTQLIQNLGLTNLHFSSMIEVSDQHIENLNQYFHYLHRKSLAAYESLNKHKQELISIPQLIKEVHQAINASREFYEKENYKIANREIKRRANLKKLELTRIQSEYDFSYKGKYSIDKLIEFYDLINSGSKEIYIQNRHCIEISRNIIYPYLHFIKIGEMNDQLKKGFDELYSSIYKMQETFSTASRKLLSTLEDKSPDKLLIGIDSSTGFSKGYLE